VALRTQQVIAFESGVTAAPDPLGGSEYLERKTCELESGARDYIRRIDDMGGMIEAIERGFPQSEIAHVSYEFQHKIESGEAVVVGVNRYRVEEEKPIETLHIDRSAQDLQTRKLQELRKTRNNEEVERSLHTLRRMAGPGTEAASSQNLMPSLLDAVRCYATLGEICGALRGVFGTYEERPHI